MFWAVQFRRVLVATITFLLLSIASPANATDGVGTFVWFDSAVWSADTDWFDGANPPCVVSVPLNSNTKYLKPSKTILADADGTGFKQLRELATDSLGMPAGARLNNGNVFIISTALDPTGMNEFRPWDDLVVGDGEGQVPSCFETWHQAREMTFKAFHSFIKQMIAPESSSDPVPVSLMFSSFRTLRFGRILDKRQHVDHLDTSGTVYFGGLTQMNATSSAPNLEPTTTDEEKALGGGRWSVHWPNNATTSTVDDVGITINFIERCIELVKYCNLNTSHDLGSSPKLDLYLDLELFQLNHVAPSNSNTTPFGTHYPGIENIPDLCLKNMAWWDKKNDRAKIPSYWMVPANVADAFWRTLRICRHKVDTYNAQRHPGDIELTLSVWVQEAYRFCSPRFAILDTTVSDSSWESDPSRMAEGYGKFNQPFGSAQVKRRTGGPNESPVYESEPWTCDCARLDPSAGPGDHTYEMQTPTIDDFNINNCIFQFVDRIAYGTYQSVPVGLVQPKGTWKNHEFRNNTAVDLTGDIVSLPPLDAHKILPGMGVPAGGKNSDTKINFAKLATFAPTAVEANETGLLPDGGWILYPPDFTGNGSEWNPLYYNPITAWPPFAANGNATPDWSSFSGQDQCGDYYGAYDMPWQGWAPFAARMLNSIDQWGQHNPDADTPKVVMTLELTPLDSDQAGSGSAGVCFKNSVGNRWVWGDNVNGTDTTPCASGQTTAGPNQWPSALIDPLCQTDRVLYVFGGDSSATLSSGTLRIGDAWGFAAVDRLLQQSTGPSGSPLSDHLDPTTPYAINNHFSYHCLLTHSPMSGFYTSTSAYGADPVTGERSCWDPYDGKFDSCSCPTATQYVSGASNLFYNMGTPGDVTGNHRTDIEDVLAVIDRWGDACPWPCAYDTDLDGQINVHDLLSTIEGWGADWN